MSTLELLSELKAQQIKIRLEGDNLKFLVSSGSISPELAGKLKENKQELVSFLRGSAAKTYRLSRGQRRMWVLSRILPNPPAFSENWAAFMEGSLNPEHLERAINEILKRHEALKTCFRMYGKRPQQVVRDDVTTQLNVVDLGQLSETAKDKQVRQWLEQAGLKSFDMENGPLVRASLLMLGRKRYVLMISMHKLVADNWSMGLFLREMETFYNMFKQGEPLPEHDPEKQYADFVRWQREWLRSETSKEQLDYWTQKLAGSLPVLELPGDRPRSRVNSFRTNRTTLHFPQPLIEKLKLLGDSEGTNLFILMMLRKDICSYYIIAVKITTQLCLL